MSDSESQFPEPDPVLSVQCLIDVYGPAHVAQAVPAEIVQAAVAGLSADKLQALAETIRQLLETSGQPPASGQ